MDLALVGLGVIVFVVGIGIGIGIKAYKTNKSGRHVGTRPPKPPRG